MSESVRRVFISSTYLDNAERRKLVEDAVLRAGMTPVGMERFTASWRGTVEECQRLARECDVYVGIVAYRYGWIPSGHERSVTEIEYLAAKEAGRPRLMFVLDGSVPVDSRKDYDDGPERWDKQKKLDAFKAAFNADQMAAPFTDMTLGAMVLDALMTWRRDGGAGARAVGARRARHRQPTSPRIAAPPRASTPTSTSPASRRDCASPSISKSCTCR